jgi:hypothetical protein
MDKRHDAFTPNLHINTAIPDGLSQASNERRSVHAIQRLTSAKQREHLLSIPRIGAS